MPTETTIFTEKEWKIATGKKGLVSFLCFWWPVWFVGINGFMLWVTHRGN